MYTCMYIHVRIYAYICKCKYLWFPIMHYQLSIPCCLQVNRPYEHEPLQVSRLGSRVSQELHQNSWQCSPTFKTSPISNLYSLLWPSWWPVLAICRQQSVCPSSKGGGFKIYCTQVRMGSNPVADMSGWCHSVTKQCFTLSSSNRVCLNVRPLRVASSCPASGLVLGKGGAQATLALLCSALRGGASARFLATQN